MSKWRATPFQVGMILATRIPCGKTLWVSIASIVDHQPT
jgi:hypothetical protein